MAQKTASPKSRRRADPIAELRTFSLRYPGAHTKSPWPTHLDAAVNNKTFAYLSAPGKPMRVSCKLPRTAATALLLPFASPTPYGLGNSGWVTAQFEPEDDVPVALLKEWIDESYRAQAPKKLVAELDGGAKASARKPPRR